MTYNVFSGTLNPTHFTSPLQCLNDGTLSMLSKQQHVVVDIDSSKAFDVVSQPNCILIRGIVLT